MLLQIQNSDIEFVHVSGKNIPVADTLSRNYVGDTCPELTKELDVHIHTVIKGLSVSDDKLQEVRLASEEDGQFQTLKRAITEGWSDNRQTCPKSILEFGTTEMNYLLVTD